MEGTVIIWDISQNSSVRSTNSKNEQNFFEMTRSCISRFIQRKIFSKPKDEIGLIVTGSNLTNNNLHQTMGGYENIKLMFDLAKANWQMVRILEQSVKIENGPADWLDALVVAMDYLRTMLETRKYTSRKIILFTTFTAKTDSENLQMIVNGLNGLGIEVVVINDNVTYSENEGDDVPMLLPKNRPLSQVQKDSEGAIQQIVKETSGYFCNFEYAIVNLMYFPPQTVRGIPWNCDLTIGTKFRMKISSYLYIAKAEKVLPTWKTEAALTHNQQKTAIVTEHCQPESALPTIECKLVTEYFKGDEKFEEDIDKEIKGYVLGTSVISIDTEIKPDNSAIKCFMCIGFTNKKYIVEEYFVGVGTSIVVARKACESSEKMMFALVEAMFKTKTVMLVRRVYNNGHQPKLFVLYPKYHENQFPCFSMFELGFYENRVYYDFPNLLSKKLEPSAEQFDLIDNLIDKMDLMSANEDDSGTHQAFAFKKTLNPINQYTYRCVAQRAINPNESLAPPDKELLDMFEIPAKLKQDAQPYLDQIKDAFQLEEVIKPKFQFKFQINLRTDEKSNGDSVNLQSLNENFDDRSIVAVGTVTPMEDFVYLIKKGEKFSILCKQLQSVLYDLLFKSITEQYNKIKIAMVLYRNESKVLGAHYYNDWIDQFKQTIVSRGRMDFWETVIVGEQLGLLSASDCDTTTITDATATEFYTIEAAMSVTDETAMLEDVDFDVLFDDM